MNFLLEILSLYILFSLASATAINVQNCDDTRQTWIQNAVKEAVDFSGKAEKTLQLDALGLPVGQEIHSQLQTHLDAFLSPKVPQDIYQSIHDDYQKIATSLGNVDITYSCGITQVQVTDVQSPFSDQRRGDRRVYPIPLQRISGAKNPRRLKNCFFDDDGKYLLIFMDPEDPNALEYAETVAASRNINSGLYDYQIACTGSYHEWFDIILKQSLAVTYDGSMVTFQQWPSILNKQTWRDIIDINYNKIPKMPKIQIDNILTETILHEYFHTLAVSAPTEGHTDSALTKTPANSLFQILQTAEFEGLNSMPIPINQNPATRAWLCISLAMPWYKLYDEKAMMDDKNKQWDGILRYNTNSDGGIWYPKWVLNGKNTFSKEEERKILEKGPNYQCQVC